MQKKEQKYQISIICYYLFLFSMFFAKGIGLYDGQGLYRILFWGGMLFAAGKIFLTEYSRKEWIAIIVLGALAVLMERTSGEKGVLICYALIMGMKNIPVKRIMQIGAVIFGVTMCGMVIYYSIFLEQSYAMEDTRIFIGETIRYSLGYPHPNNLLSTYLALVTMVVYWLKEKYHWKHALLLEVGVIYLYSYCKSYTGFITCTLMIILPLYMIYFRKNKFGVLEYGVAIASIPVCLFYSVFAPYILPDSVMEFLKKNFDTLHSRFLLSKMHFRPENISLLGTRVEEVTTSVYSLDNSFLYCVVFNGVIFSLIMLGGYCYLMYYLIKEKKDFALLVTCIFLLTGLIEPLLFNSSFKNISLLFLGEAVWKNACCRDNTDMSREEYQTRTCNILGVQIAIITMAQAVDFIEKKIQELRGKYITVCNGHTSVMAYEDPEYRAIQNNAVLSLPDGEPLSIVSRLRGYDNATRVTGPDLMEELFISGENGNGLRHYFYGGTEDTLEQLEKVLTEKYPNLKIAGMYSPPFRLLTEEEKQGDIQRINESKADIIWVGLGAPKQEKWMFDNRDKLNGVAIGVGAGFDYHAGKIKRAPKWMQTISMEWFVRLLQDPRRLWKRYLVTNIKFICYALLGK